MARLRDKRDEQKVTNQTILDGSPGFVSQPEWLRQNDKYATQGDMS
jgi:hypothetical protein